MGDRSATADRFRAPVAVAAAVALLVGGTMIVVQSTGGTSAGSGPPTSTSSTPPPSSPPESTSSASSSSPPSSGRPDPSSGAPSAPPLPIPPIDPGLAAADLDRCWAVASASPRAAEFAPRESWQPVFAVELNGHRILAYREHGSRPMFCDTTATTATVSDPSAEPMSMGGPGAPFYGLYLSPAGILAGVAQGVARLECEVYVLLDTGPGGGTHFLPRTAPVTLHGIQFMAHVGELKDGDEISTTAYDASGNRIAAGGMRFERARVRPAVTG